MLKGNVNQKWNFKSDDGVYTKQLFMGGVRKDINNTTADVTCK